MQPSSLVALLASTAVATTAHADLITWGSAQNTTGVADVRTAGNLVTARNTWAGTSSSPVVAGITFTGFAPTGWTNGATSALNGSTTGDAGYDTLLGSARATSESVLTNPTGFGGIRLDTLGTLNVGTQYEIQVWYTDQRVGTTQLNDRRMAFGSATGPATLTGGVVNNIGSLTVSPSTVTLDADPNNLAGAGDAIFGQYAVGTFTRTSSDQLWLLVQGSHPNTAYTLRPHISAFQIREITYSVVSYCTAGTSTNGCVPAISASGIPSAAATSGFTIQVANVEGQKQGLIFYGVSGQSTSPWGSGGTSFLCVKAPTQRMTTQNSGGTAGACDGAMSEDWLAYIAAHPTSLGAPFSAGAVVNAQGWYRDPPAVKTTNLSDGLEIVLAP